MSIQIQRKKDDRVVRAFTHKCADIPNGVTVVTSELTQKILHEGTPIGIDSDHKGHVVKCAVVAADAGSSATTYTVKKGHNLKVDDVVMTALGGKAYAISSITTNSSDATLDDIVVGTTLGALSEGAILVQANASGASAGAFKYAPVALVGESYNVDPNENLIVNAVTIGQLKAACAPAIADIVKKALPAIVFI